MVRQLSAHARQAATQASMPPMPTVTTCVAHLRANGAQFGTEYRIAQLEISRCFAQLGAVHHQGKVSLFDMLSSDLQAMIHRRLNTAVVALGAGIDTRLRYFLRHHMSSISRFLSMDAGVRTASPLPRRLTWTKFLPLLPLDAPSRARQADARPSLN